jgi:hypothetical protein
VKNAKAQVEHVANHLLNVEVAEAKAAAVWLYHNRSLEMLEAVLTTRIKEAKEEQDRVNLKRKASQEQIMNELISNKFQRQEIIFKCWQIHGHCQSSNLQV